MEGVTKKMNKSRNRRIQNMEGCERTSCHGDIHERPSTSEEHLPGLLFWTIDNVSRKPLWMNPGLVLEVEGRLEGDDIGTPGGHYSEVAVLLLLLVHLPEADTDQGVRPGVSRIPPLLPPLGGGQSLHLVLDDLLEILPGLQQLGHLAGPGLPHLGPVHAL